YNIVLFTSKFSCFLEVSLVILNWPCNDWANTVPVPSSIRPIHSSPCPGFWRIQCNQVMDNPDTVQDSVTGSPGLFTTDSDEITHQR
ncbi:hypothetical protein DPEC_G00306840, partial [Dallia pectoralis]